MPNVDRVPLSQHDILDLRAKISQKIFSEGKLRKTAPAHDGAASFMGVFPGHIILVEDRGREIYVRIIRTDAFRASRDYIIKERVAYRFDLDRGGKWSKVLVRHANALVDDLDKLE